VLKFYSNIQSYESIHNSLCFLADPLSHSAYALFSIKRRLQSMNTNKIGMLVVLSLSLATVVMGTTGLSLVSPVFAGGDHGHGHDGKKCKNNDDNNCNDTHKTQKIETKNDCEISNYNKDHSHDNGNDNSLECANDAQNLNDVEQLDIFADGGDGALQAQSAPVDSNQSQQ
jgi:hypothetical protein